MQPSCPAWPSLLGEEALGVERGHAAGPGRGDRLPVDVVLHVAGGEHARDVRLGRARLRDEVARLVVVELVEEEPRVRIVADRDEEAVGRELRSRSPVSRVAQAHAGHLALVDAEDLLDDGVRDELDLLVRARAVDHDLGRAELVAPVDDRHLARELRQEERLLHRRVAAADDDHLAVAIEGARRRSRSTSRRGPGARARTRARAGARSRRSRRSTVSARYSSSPTQTRKGRSEKSTRVTSSVRNSVPKRSACRRNSTIICGPEDALGVPGIVLDVARDHQLAAPLEALDHERLQVGARGVERRRVAGGAAADDDQITVSICCIQRYRPDACSTSGTTTIAQPGAELALDGRTADLDSPPRARRFPVGRRLCDQPLPRPRPGGQPDSRPRSTRASTRSSRRPRSGSKPATTS